VENLRREGVERGVYLTGDVTVDAIREHVALARKRSTILDELRLSPGDYCLATVHRAENTDDEGTLTELVDAFCAIDNLIFPCHPRTEKFLKRYGLWEKLNRKARVIGPVGYLDMLMLEEGADRILTDSGGVQKEAYILGVPCITLRSSTEWVETVNDGWNVLIGTKRESILQAAREFRPASPWGNVFGSGNASRRICEILREGNWGTSMAVASPSPAARAGSP
jgi:UDP-N-acetylglucosamine 2-epimerase (non-hydrolysing)